MQFIERIIGLSPDGGSGLLEAAYIASIFLGFTAVVLHKRIAEHLKTALRRRRG